MCGRFVLFSSLEEIREAFAVQQVRYQLEPSYNVAPTQSVAVVVQREGVNTLEKMRWGLIPAWAKDPAIGSRMINARAETVGEKPSFKRPLKDRRCLVVADGFYEWQKTGQAKIPMFIRLKSGQPFGFAGLYDVWTSPEGEAVASCTIITTGANDLMQPIHDRMPVILPKSQEATWLNPAIQRAADVLPLLVPYSAADMEAYAVSRMVNSPENNSPDCIRPVGR
jgi:putative SOS response-associated peptidase YedK